MACSCTNSTREYEQQVDSLLDSVGLAEVFRQGRDTFAEAGRALIHLNRAERARLLGFEEAVVRLHFEAAGRAALRARNQMQNVLARIDGVRQREDWSANLEKIRTEFLARNGRSALDDARADLRLRWLEEDPGVNAKTAQLMLATLDSQFALAIDGDLDQIVDGMRRTLGDASLSLVPSSENDRQFWPSDIASLAASETCTIIFDACIIWAFLSLAAGIVICFAVCWCCFAWVLFLAYSAHFLSCVAAAEICKAASG